MEEINVGDVVILRKTHPCGGDRWKVVRIGADIGLECLNCGRKVFLSRRELSHRIKGDIEKNSADSPTSITP